MTTAPGSPVPPGLQPERTRLAWRRTTLGTVTVALLGVGRVATAGPRPATLAALALVGLVLVAILLLANRRIRAMEPAGRNGSDRETGPSAMRGIPASLALLVAAMALIGTLLLT